MEVLEFFMLMGLLNSLGQVLDCWKSGRVFHLRLNIGIEEWSRAWKIRVTSEFLDFFLEINGRPTLEGQRQVNPVDGRTRRPGHCDAHFARAIETIKQLLLFFRIRGLKVLSPS
jgi:hypothetical protein